MKKKRILLSLFSIGLLALAACDSNKNDTQAEEKKDPTTETEKDKTEDVVKTYYKVTLYEIESKNKTGKLLEEQNVEENKTIDLTSSKIARTGYTATIYYSNSMIKSDIFESSTAITEDITLFIGYSLIDYTISFNTDGGDAIEALKYNITDEVTLPYATKSGYIFEGWYDEDDKLVNYIPDGTSKNMTLKAKYNEAETKTRSFECNPYNFEVGQISSAVHSIFKASGQVTSNIATWTNPTDSNDKITFNNAFKNSQIKFTAPGNGKASIYIKNGSSGAATQTMNVNANGTRTGYTYAGNDSYGNYEGGSPVVKIDFDILANTDYTISGTSSNYIYGFEMECEVTDQAASGVIVQDDGDNILYEGQEFDITSVKLQSNNTLYYEDLDSKYCQIDASEVDTTTPGTYEVKINYYGYETSFNVYVYEAKELDLGFDATYTSRNSYNGIYVNGKVKTIYNLNEEFNSDYLTAILDTELGDEELTFIIDEDDITYSTLDTSTTGEKEITVTTVINDKTLTSSYKVYVVDESCYKDSNNNYVVTVDKSYTGVIGAKDGTNGNMFTTIAGALEYLERLDAASSKIMNVKKGYYNEKLEINVANLTIVGEGYTKATYSTNENYTASEYQAATIIEWDSLYDVPDASGYSQVTDSTATVAVRESAINCTFKNITLSNYYNCEEAFTAKYDFLSQYGVAGSEHRALALIVQADKFTMDNCSLLGYQDTVEFMTGRQLIKNTYICGVTDYMFGTNATTYFYNCELHAILNANKGGYTTAYRGINGTGTDITYGLIYDHCKFTADSGVGEGTMALGRPWGDHSKVMIMNSTISKAYSTAAYSGKSSGTRYVSMSGNEPTDENVTYLEYNNTGDGAIKTSITGCTVVDATTAANYSNFSIIFGTTNGNWTYSDAWNPTL